MRNFPNADFKAEIATQSGIFADFSAKSGLRQIYGSDDPRRLRQIYPVATFLEFYYRYSIFIFRK